MRALADPALAILATAAAAAAIAVLALAVTSACTRGVPAVPPQPPAARPAAVTLTDAVLPPARPLGPRPYVGHPGTGRTP